ncbi:hypothetical protein [Nocardia cyriacigeorgica]|uniref:hypothetical protein n=1 Tax=Nocardia cyriacigeorgica TaxID=135487 RepID=UPI002456795E|nr:hypothetical protein [Nocardia cyriacigeorgica]
MNHNTKGQRYQSLERRHRVQIIGGLRDQGMGYGEIARTLGITLAQVEKCLGEAAALREQGMTKQEVADEIGVPYGSLRRVLVVTRRGVTARQSAALAAASDMHGMQVDVLAEFFNISLSSAYDLAKALRERGLIHPLETVQPGRAWLYPKREVAERYLGWRPKEWRPPLMFANHYRAVTQARIMLVGSDPQLWVSERTLRRRAEVAATETKSGQLMFSTGRSPQAGRPHVHDGRFLGAVDGQHGWWALEVELTRKREPKKIDLALQGAIRAARDSEEEQIIGLLYLCGSEPVINTVNAAYQRLPRELAELKLLFAIGDFNDEWTKFLTNRRRTRAANRGPVLHLSQEAS